jgi:glycosyltransferase involved in cell wall biosynthesis
MSTLQRLFKRDLETAPLDEYDARLRGSLSMADRLLTPSEHTRTKFIEMGVLPGRIFSAPYGLPVDLFRGVTRAASPALRVGYLGSIIPSKGAHVLIEAFRKLDRSNVRLDLYGAVVPYHGDATYESRLRALASDDPRITLHGRYENKDLPEILGKIDILVVPSIWWETFCITIREGWLGGVPVVASRLGALAEAIEDGATGLLFEPGDPDDLARALSRLCDDPSLRARLAEGSFERVKTIALNTDEMLEHYRAAIAVRDGKRAAPAARRAAGCETCASPPRRDA